MDRREAHGLSHARLRNQERFSFCRAGCAGPVDCPIPSDRCGQSCAAGRPARVRFRGCPEFPRGLYFRGSPGRFSRSTPTNETFVQPSLSVARRTAVRASAWQAVAVLVLAVVFGLAAGPAHAAGVLVGGFAMVLGSALAAWFMVGGGVNPAGVVLGRWFLGMVAKWLLVLVALWLGLAVWRVPALPLLAGLVVALLAHVIASTRRPRSTR
ncbi:hypothetical protein EYQ95_22280 [Lysobacter sp. N42]|nr:hypothetical protein EYQ95_22280 [Lysobacter sp. N42]